MNFNTRGDIQIPTTASDTEDMDSLNEAGPMSPRNPNISAVTLFRRTSDDDQIIDNDNSSVACSLSTGTSSSVTTLNLQSSTRLVSNLTSESIIIMSEKQMDLDTQRRHLIETYQTCEPYPYNKETLSSIGKIV